MLRLLFTSLGISISLIALNGCQQAQSSADLDAPMFGKAKANSTFLVSTDQPVGVEELVRVARIIGPYRQLRPEEVSELELKLGKALNRLVEIEYQQMLEEEKNGTLPRPFRGLKVTRASARERLLARLGKDLALPVLTSDNRSAVVFSRVSKADINVSPTAYEINEPTTQGPPQQVLTPSGVRATYIDPLP